MFKDEIKDEIKDGVNMYIFMILLVVIVTIGFMCWLIQIAKNEKKVEREARGLVESVEEADYQKLNLKIVTSLDFLGYKENYGKAEFVGEGEDNELKNGGYYLEKLEDGRVLKIPLKYNSEILNNKGVISFYTEDGSEVAGNYNIFEFPIFLDKYGKRVDVETQKKLENWNNETTTHKIKFFEKDLIEVKDSNENKRFMPMPFIYRLMMR